MDIVNELKQRLMPALYEICQTIRSELPNIKVKVQSNDGGGATSEPWHVLGIFCRLHEDWDDLPNEINMFVSAYKLKTSPTLQFGVWWDHPSYETEYDLFWQAVPASDEAIQMIEISLPHATEILKDAARKGRPSINNERNHRTR